MKRVVLLLTLAIFGVAWGVSAQTDLPSSCSAFYPDVLAKKAVIELSDARVIAEGSRYGQTPKPKNPKHWVVYSDRENNTTYTRPGGGEKFSSLDFNEQVRIAKEVLHACRHSVDVKKLVKGLMIESYLEDGAQKIGPDEIYGKSITDPCLGWEKTERLIYDIADSL